MSDVVTPAQVEKRLLALGTELDEAHKELVNSEHMYMSAKSSFEIESARARLTIKNSSEKKLTVSDIEDEALMQTQLEYVTLNTAEATVRAARANIQRVRAQIDIARSVGSSVRASMEL